MGFGAGSTWAVAAVGMGRAGADQASAVVPLLVAEVWYFWQGFGW